MKIITTIALTVALALAGARAADTADDRIQVLCSNGIKGPVAALLPEAERVVGQPIAIEYGASTVLRRTIEGGGQFDLAILTPQVIGALAKTGAIAADTQTELARTNLAIGVRAGSAKLDTGTADAIRRRLLAARSITYAKEGAANDAIGNMLDGLGIAKAVAGKIVLQTVSGGPAASVADGKNELVFAPVSEILIVPGVEVLALFPPEFQRPLVMTAGLSARTSRAAAAKRLVAFLKSPAAARAMKAGGMDPAAP